MNETEVLDRIQYFLEFKHWTLYKLAKESGVPYSSLNNSFHKKTTPTFFTLQKICNGLGISLSEFFDYKTTPLRDNNITETEQDILNAYRNLSVHKKELLQAYLQGLSEK